MRYEPIRTLVDLNALGQARATESRSLDFKEQVRGKEWWELAKDIAAFANHVGGTILVGAAEQPGGSATFFGIDPDTAKDLASKYENAAKDRCKPRPIVIPDAIELGPTKVVLAVNVEPFPLGPVGAMFYARNRDGKPEKCDAWRFPVRVGKHNVPLQPDQIAMFMEPRIRRIVTLLEDAISPAPRRQSAIFLITSSATPPVKHLEIRGASVDVRANAFVFVESSSQLHVPLDDIEAVWRRENGWHVRVSGAITGAGTDRHYASAPRRG